MRTPPKPPPGRGAATIASSPLGGCPRVSPRALTATAFVIVVKRGSGAYEVGGPRAFRDGPSAVPRPPSPKGLGGQRWIPHPPSPMSGTQGLGCHCLPFVRRTPPPSRPKWPLCETTNGTPGAHL